MTTISVQGDLGPSITRACVLAGVANPTSVTGGLGNQPSVLTWTPDLSPADQATVNAIVKLAVGATLITKAERDTLEPFLTTGRAFQQQSQSEFIALAQNARDRMLFDNVTALWRVVRMFLRD